MSIPRVFNDLLDACTQPGCPVCRLVNQAVERYMDNLFYENVNDGALRTQLRSSLGFAMSMPGWRSSRVSGMHLV